MTWCKLSNPIREGKNWTNKTAFLIIGTMNTTNSSKWQWYIIYLN